MIVVLDTNVLVSALISPFGMPARVLDLTLAGEITLAYDDRILAEYRTILGRRRFAFGPDDVATLLAFIRDEGVVTSSVTWPRPMIDSDDVPFIEVAAAAAAILITGNRRHYPLDAVPPVRVMAPAEFIAMLAG